MSTRQRTYPAHTTTRRILRSAILTTALAAVGGGVLAAPAAAGPSRPDLVAAGPVSSISGSAQNTGAYATVTNIGNGDAAATTVTFRFQPVVRLFVNGQATFINAPGSAAITGTGTVGALVGTNNRLGLNSRSVSAQLSGTPGGLNKVTVCADSSAALFEASESNNCFTEIKDVKVIFFG